MEKRSILKRGICFMMSLLLCSMSFVMEAAAWSNPRNDITDTWDEYGNGDPFVMKFNGIYYLYVSTRDDLTGIKCWSSRDMADWKYEGLCIEDETTLNVSKAAYAPEVFYHNGKFYMYTSPAGRGHYVLESASPTGPFVKATENFGHSIDGSVFIDDDGKWYFYYASDQGILAKEMSSPTTLAVQEKNLGARMNGWTEGPFVIKKNGRYFLTYTGNHVHSKGYRINYSVGDSPVSFRNGMGNPVLLNTEEGIVGLGHSSTVLGPDLSTYYLIYHNLEGKNQWGWPIRNMNMDRIAFNGDKMTVLGPTVTEQDNPALPAISNYFDDGAGEGFSIIGNSDGSKAAVKEGRLELEAGVQFLSEADLIGNFTAEYNVSSKDETGEIGGYFSYQDADNYGKAGIDLASGKLKVTKKVGGTEETVSETEIAKSFNQPYDFSALHTLRVEREEKLEKQENQSEKKTASYSFYFDGRKVCEAEIPQLGNGKIGYYTAQAGGAMGFIAGSQEYGDSGIFNAYKPVPGVIQAVHFNDGPDGCYDKTENNIGLEVDKHYYRNTPVDIGYTDNQFRIGWNQTGEWYKYNINAAETGTYDFGLKYVSAIAEAEGDISYNLYVDDELVVEKEVISRTKDWSTYRTAIRRNIPLTKGRHTIKLETASGEFDFRELKFVRSETVEPLYVDYSTKEDGNTYSNGKFRVEDGKLTIDAVGKRLYGSRNWGDYTIETDIVPEDSINCGVILRVNNPSLGGAGDDSQAGTDFYQGYFVGLSSGSMVLGKQNYDWKELQRVNRNIQIGKTYHLRIEAVKDNIKVYVNDEETPAIDYTDLEDPFMNGKAGYRVHFASTSFDNLMVYEKKEDLAEKLKKEQVITVEENFEKVMGDEAFSLGAVSSGDGKLTYDVTPEGVVSVDDTGKVSVIGAGTAHITVTAAGTDSYKEAEKAVTVAVKKQKQVITTGIGIAAGKTFSLNAASSGDGALSYSAAPEGIVSVDANGKVTIIGEGTAQITIRAAETDRCEAAELTIPVQIEKDTAEIQKVQQIITVEKNFEKVMGDAAFSLGAVSNGNGSLSYSVTPEGVVSVDGNGKVSVIGKGTAQITITAAETDTYNKAEETVTVTVKEKSGSGAAGGDNGTRGKDEENKKPQKEQQVITAKNITKTFGAKAFSIGAKTSGTGKLAYAVERPKVAAIDKNGKITIKGCGKTAVKITAEENDSFLKAEISVTLTVKPKQAKISSLKSKKKKSVTVKWKKDAKATGYLIQYAADKKFKKGKKTITITKNKTVNHTIKGLKSRKKYYFRVCAYKKDGKNKIKGGWSKVKTAKVR